MTPTDLATLLALLSACTTDLNGSGTVNGADLSILLACYGDEGDDLVQLGQCESYATLPACIAEREAEFRASVSDVPTAGGAPYPVGYIVGDFNRNGVVDGQDVSVFLADFGCAN